MELKGIYVKSITEYYNCTMIIENGIVHRVIVPNAKPIEYFTINPKNNATFEYHKLPTKKGIGQIDSNYKIEYENESGNTNTVYVKLSGLDLFKLKRQKKELLVQDRGLKIGLIKSLILAIFSFISFLLGTIYEKHKASTIDHNIENHTADITKEAKINNTESENKTDSTNLKSSESLNLKTD